MAKNLSLNIELRGKGAETALKGITRAFREADAEEKKFSKTTKTTESDLKKQEVQTKKNSTALDAFRRVASKAGSAMATSFKGVGGTLVSIGKTLGGLIKRMMTLASVMLGVSAFQIGRSFLDFDRQFTLMNATLRAKLPETKKLIKDAMFESSGKSGIASAELTDSLNQLFSSGLAPTALEGTDEYIRQVEEVIKINEYLAMSAKATATPIEEMQKAYVYAANAFGFNLSNLEDTQKIMDLFANTLDTGLGWMKEYAPQFAKFGPEARQAGASVEEAFSVFAQLTTMFDPNMAGFIGGVIFRELNQTAKNITLGTNRITSALKDSGLSAKAQAFLRDFEKKGTWEDLFYSDELTDKGERKRRSFEETLKGFQKLMKSVTPGTDVYDALIYAMFGNIRQKKGMEFLLNGDNLENLFGEGGAVDKMKTGGSMDEKIRELEASPSQKWDRFKVKVQNGFLQLFSDLDEEVNMLFDKLLKWGEEFGVQMKNLAKWLNSPESEGFRKSIQYTFSALKGIAKLILITFQEIGNTAFGKWLTAGGKVADWFISGKWLNWGTDWEGMTSKEVEQMLREKYDYSPRIADPTVDSGSTASIVNKLNEVVAAINGQKLSNSLAFSVNVDERGKANVLATGSGGSYSVVS